MADRLAGKIAIITGGASGIGAAMTRRFVAEGAKVLFTDLGTQAAHGRELAGQLGSAAQFLIGDVTSADDCSRAVKTAQDLFGMPTVLVNNAGIAIVGGVEELAEDDW